MKRLRNSLLVKTICIAIVGLCLQPQPVFAASGTPKATPAGPTFTLPDAWTATMTGKVMVLHPLEPDCTLALIDVEAKDAVSAVAAGWSAFDPNVHRTLKLSSQKAPRNGWEEQAQFDYEVSPNEKLFVRASA